jgi:hypothetical protein
MAISGGCITESFNVPFVLNGLGQNNTTNCNYGPGSPISPTLGNVVPHTGILSSLQVVQTSLSSGDNFGGQIQIYLEPFNGAGGWIATSITCTLTESILNPLESTTSCSDSSHTVSVTAGQKVLALVTPPTDHSAFAPVQAVLSITY